VTRHAGDPTIVAASSGAFASHHEPARDMTYFLSMLRISGATMLFCGFAAQPAAHAIDSVPRSTPDAASVTVAMSVAWGPNKPFVGKWKLIPSESRMPDEMMVRSKGGNKYAFDFGGAAETIVVDGSEQAGLGGTLLSVKPEAPDTWIVRRSNGRRLLLSATWKLSSDESTLTDYYREFESDGSTRSVDYVYQRKGGGSGFAADWHSIRETINSPFLLEVKEFQGDGLSFVDPLAQRTKKVKFDGRDYPASGVQKAGRGPSSSIRRLDERTLMITNKYDGKVSNTEQFSLSPDLKTLTMTVHIIGRDNPYVLTFERT
jgi:hypothetical protein